MKYWIKILVLTLSFYSNFTHAQISNAEEKALLKTVHKLYYAMVHKEKGDLEFLTLKELTYGHSSGIIENRTEFIEAIMNGPFEFLSITPIDQSISIYENTGIVRHIFKAKGRDKGVEVDVNIGALLIFNKVGGQWKLLARQAYKL